MKEILSEVPGLELVNGYLKIQEWSNGLPCKASSYMDVNRASSWAQEAGEDVIEKLKLG